MYPAMRVCSCIAFTVLVVFTRVNALGHLPAAYLPPSPLGSFWGNANRTDALAEIQVLAKRILLDPVVVPGTTQTWPWKREVISASLYGATPNDGLDDTAGINQVNAYACSRSQALYNEYKAKIAANASLPILLSGPEDRPVLVELRYPAGVYDVAGDLGGGTGCEYLLINGRNSTIRTHFEAGYATSMVTDAALFSCTSCTNIYIYNFVFDTYWPATTIVIVSSIQTDASGAVTGFTGNAWGAHTAWSDSSANFQHIGPYGGYALWDQPYSVFGGFTATTAVCAGTSENQVGGCMTVTFPSGSGYDQSIGPYLAKGQWFGIARQYIATSISSMSSSNIILQGIRSIGLSTEFNIYYGGGQNVEIIDFHEDRVWPNHMYVDSTRRSVGLQSFQGGNWRIWHTSWEAGSDDMLDAHNTVANVVAVSPSSRSVTAQLTWGVFAGCDTGFFPLVGDSVGFSHASAPATIYATLTVQSVSEIVSGQCGNTLTFVESLPSGMVSGDFLQNLSEGPNAIHIKNARMGNHHYNILNIKGHYMLVEDSFFYNCSLSAIDVVADICGYWCEAPRSDNIAIRNNVFSNTNQAIMIQAIGPTGNAADLQSVALVDSARNVSISNNTIYYNATELVEQDDSPSVNSPIQLSGITGFRIVNNVIWTTPGARNDIPLIQLCNMQNGVMAGNKVLEAPFAPSKGGYLCTANNAASCPAYPIKNTLNWQTEAYARGCSSKNSGNVTITADNTWQSGVVTTLGLPSRKRDRRLRG
jgi:hypothetical protein